MKESIEYPNIDISQIEKVIDRYERGLHKTIDREKKKSSPNVIALSVAEAIEDTLDRYFFNKAKKVMGYVYLSSVYQKGIENPSIEVLAFCQSEILYILENGQPEISEYFYHRFFDYLSRYIPNLEDNYGRMVDKIPTITALFNKSMASIIRGNVPIKEALRILYFLDWFSAVPDKPKKEDMSLYEI